METYTKLKGLVKNPHYPDQRRDTLAGLSDEMIDAPIIELIHAFNRLSYCFTLQCCYGHFLYEGQNDDRNLDPLPITDTISEVEYRIAYICLCIENSELGKRLLGALSQITAIDPNNIQLCCAEWFWDRQINSYALQVEPERFKHEDKAILPYQEALHVEKIRNGLFVKLQELVRKQPGENCSDFTSDCYLTPRSES